MSRAARAVGLALITAMALAGVAAPARAAGSQAVVIVDTGATTYTRVISFSGSISGYQALELAGASPETYGFAGQGAAICRLFGVGNDPSGSSCLGTPDDPRYWAYFRAPAGSSGWRYSQAGAGSTTVSDGDVEGWRFGTGGAPTFRAFCDVVACAPAPTAAAPDPAPAPAPPGAVPDAGATAAPDGSGPAGLPGAGSAGTPAVDERATTDAAAAPPTSALVAPPTTGVAPRRTSAGDGRALSARPVVDDGGSGSPIGVLVAVVLVGGIGALAVVLRRRNRPAD